MVRDEHKTRVKVETARREGGPVLPPSLTHDIISVGDQLARDLYELSYWSRDTTRLTPCTIRQLYANLANRAQAFHALVERAKAHVRE